MLGRAPCTLNCQQVVWACSTDTLAASVPTHQIDFYCASNNVSPEAYLMETTADEAEETLSIRSIKWVLNTASTKNIEEPDHHKMGNDDVALVQARQAFVDKDEYLVTRLHNINSSFHFEFDQVNSIFINYFCFNGTAGVWRIKPLEESRGRLERTPVRAVPL